MFNPVQYARPQIYLPPVIVNYLLMQYVNLGKSGLKVSVISYGNMVNNKPQNYEEDKLIVQKCLQAGINFFDTAQIYAMGESQRVLGRILKELKVQRESVIIATKVWTSNDPERNSTSNVSRKHVKQAVSKSLQRLNLQYVDILFAHGYDQDTPLQQVCRSFHQLIEDGKTFYWGTSNWNAEDVFNAFRYCEQHNLHKPICAQNQYNLLVRKDIEFEYQKLFEKYGYGLVCWSPLAGGFLTGKHLDGIKQDGGRLTGVRGESYKKYFFTPYYTEKIINGLKQLQEYVAKQLNSTLTEVAIAWCIKYKHTSTALIGARTVAQLEQILNALKIVEKLTPEVEGKINKLIGTTPEARINFLQWKQYDPVRPVEK